MTTSHTDPELFELCKEVYKLTEWNYSSADPTREYVYSFEAKKTGSYWEAVYDEHRNKDPFDNRRPTGITHHIESLCPLYTSDYLLEKLQPTMEIFDLFLATNPGVGWWIESFDNEVNISRIDADTPLKALLKLTIALPNK